MRYISAILLGLGLLSCNRNTHEEMSKYHEDGRLKPNLAIASMIDTTSFDSSWSLSEELTSMIVSQVSASGQIYVCSQDESPYSQNPFSSDLSWMKREFQGQEFIVFLELVEHEAVPVNKGRAYSPQETSTNLNMAVRIRVVDLRPSTPKIVLQEMIRDSYFIPKTLIPVDYTTQSWGTEEYAKTPMAIAHNQLVREIANRISDYVLLAKSR